MGIDISDAAPEKRSAIDKVEDLVIRHYGGLGQLSQSAQHKITFAQSTESELARHKAMPEYFSAVEQMAEQTIAGPQVVDQTDVSTRITRDGAAVAALVPDQAGFRPTAPAGARSRVRSTP
jgi:hypothetical protein